MLTLLSMGIAERKEREKESLRQEILDAAREIFVAEGYDALSMRKVAERIEYSPTTIYLYFRDKSELLREVCEEAFMRLGEAVGNAWKGSGTPLEALRRGVHAYIEFGLSHPHHYEVAFISPNKIIRAKGEYRFEGSAGQRSFDMLGNAVRKCMDAGELRADDPAKVAQTIWAHIHGVTSLLIMHGGFPFVDRGELIESVVETTIRGLRE